jgi:hypothetical protein
MFEEIRTSFAIFTAPGIPTYIGAPRPGGAPADPVVDGVVVEADLAGDVRRVGLLLVHRLDGVLVADQGVALRVAGDADLLEAVPDLVHRPEQRCGALELAGGLRRVARHDEDVPNVSLAQPRQDLAELRPVPDEPRREVRGDLEALLREPLGQLQGGT